MGNGATDRKILAARGDASSASIPADIRTSVVTFIPRADSHTSPKSIQQVLSDPHFSLFQAHVN